MSRFSSLTSSTILVSTILVFGLTSASCGDSAKPQGAASAQTVQTGMPMEISLEDFDQQFKADKTIHILDVRTPDEYQQFHAEGSILLPLQEMMSLGDRLTEKVPFAKDDMIYVICQSGNRSFTATRILRSKGYDKAVSVRGGTAGFVRMGNECGAGYVACN